MAEVNMLKIFYLCACFFEMIFGITVIHRLYPEFRFARPAMKFLVILFYSVFACFYAWNSWMFYVSNLFVLAGSLILAASYWLFWRSNLLEVFLWFAFYYTNLSILKLPVLTIRGIAFHEDVIQANRSPRLFSETVYILMIILMISILFRKYKIMEKIAERLLLKDRMICVLVIAAEWLMLSYGMNIGKFGFHITDLIINMMIILCAVMVLLYLTLFSAYHQIKSESILQQAVYENLKDQYYGLQEMHEKNSRWIHDMKHKLMYISSYLEDEDISSAHEKVKQYLWEIKIIEKKVWTGFSFLDFVLNYKKAEIDKKEIEFVFNVELQQLTIPEEDLVVILGNLLDNAIEATCKCEENRRCIRLKIGNLNEMMLLNIGNSSSEMPQLKNGIFISSKKEEGVHGLGIESVKRIVESYDGEIHFEYTENDFQVQILI